MINLQRVSERVSVELVSATKDKGRELSGSEVSKVADWTTKNEVGYQQSQQKSKSDI